MKYKFLFSFMLTSAFAFSASSALATDWALSLYDQQTFKKEVFAVPVGSEKKISVNGWSCTLGKESVEDKASNRSVFCLKNKALFSLVVACAKGGVKMIGGIHLFDDKVKKSSALTLVCKP